jgi:hypothetical protein
LSGKSSSLLLVFWIELEVTSDEVINSGRTPKGFDDLGNTGTGRRILLLGSCRLEPLIPGILDFSDGV